MWRALLSLALIGYAAEATSTCGDLSKFYKNQACCGSDRGQPICVDEDANTVSAKLSQLLAKVPDMSSECASTEQHEAEHMYDYIVQVGSNWFRPKHLVVPELSRVMFNFVRAGHNVWSQSTPWLNSVSGEWDLNPVNTLFTPRYMSTNDDNDDPVEERVIDYVCTPHISAGQVGTITVKALSPEDYGKRIIQISRERTHQVRDAWNGLARCAHLARQTLNTPSHGDVSDDSADLPAIWKKIAWGSPGFDDSKHLNETKIHVADMLDITKNMLNQYKKMWDTEYSADQVLKGGQSEIKWMADETSLDPYVAYHELGEAIEHIPKLFGARFLFNADQTSGDSLAVKYDKMKTDYLKNPEKVNWTVDVPEYKKYGLTDAQQETYGVLIDGLVDFVKGAGYSIASTAACYDTVTGNA